jgi:hypothetical protein
MFGFAPKADMPDFTGVLNEELPDGASMRSRRVRGLGSCRWRTKWLAGEEGIEPSLARFWRPPLCR